MALQEYFIQPDKQRLALEAYTRVVSDRGWPTHGVLDMYEATLRAFDPAVPYDEAFRVFNSKIYAELSSYWLVFRPFSPARCWNSQEIFDTLKSEFSQFAIGTDVTLPNLMSSIVWKSLLPSLAKMKDIKPNKAYPSMTVSKFLHFYNPAVFPIYDFEVVWKTVLEKRFKMDFRQFCEASRLGYDIGDTVFFLRNYIGWASHLLASAHPQFMELFARWLQEQPLCRIESRKSLVPLSLYATAFEFVVIGAAEAEKTGGGRFSSTAASSGETAKWTLWRSSYPHA